MLEREPLQAGQLAHREVARAGRVVVVVAAAGDCVAEGAVAGVARARPAAEPAHSVGAVVWEVAGDATDGVVDGVEVAEMGETGAIFGLAVGGLGEVGEDFAWAGFYHAVSEGFSMGGMLVFTRMRRGIVFSLVAVGRNLVG